MTHNFQLDIIHTFVYNFNSSTHCFSPIRSVLWLTSNLISPNLLNSQSPSSESKMCAHTGERDGVRSHRGAVRLRTQRMVQVFSSISWPQRTQWSQSRECLSFLLLSLLGVRRRLAISGFIISFSESPSQKLLNSLSPNSESNYPTTLRSLRSLRLNE